MADPSTPLRAEAVFRAMSADINLGANEREACGLAVDALAKARAWDRLRAEQDGVRFSWVNAELMDRLLREETEGATR